MNPIDQRPNIKLLAYGLGRERRFNPIRQGTIFRLERGRPYQRNGTVVVAQPQFKSSPIFSPTTQNIKSPFKSSSNVEVNIGGRYQVK